MTLHRRHRRHDGRATDSWQGFQNKPPRRHQGTGISGTYTCVCFTSADKVGRNAKRRVLFLAERISGRFVHTHDFTGVYDSDPGLNILEALKQWFNFLDLSDQDQA